MKTGFFNVLRALGIRTHRAFRLLLRGLALLVGAVAAYRVSYLMEKGDFDGSAIAFGVVLAAAIFEFIVGDLWADRSFPFDTERKLALLEKRLGRNAIETISKRLAEETAHFKGCDTSVISSTVHIFTELTATADHRVRKGLLQLTDYVGPKGGKKGRITLITQGIIGRCARTGELETVDFAHDAEYRSSMVRDFGFTKEEAARHTTTARSYMAIPLTNDEGAIVGVLYFFSIEPQVFPQAANIERLHDLAREIVNYVTVAQLM